MRRILNPIQPTLRTRLTFECPSPTALQRGRHQQGISVSIQPSFSLPVLQPPRPDCLPAASLASEPLSPSSLGPSAPLGSAVAQQGSSVTCNWSRLLSSPSVVLHLASPTHSAAATPPTSPTTISCSSHICRHGLQRLFHHWQGQAVSQGRSQQCIG